jgi:anti-sigma-K factor RskA
MTSDAPDIHTLSGAYALDALDPAEAAAFEGHLESCESCRDEVRSFRDAVGALADDVATPAPERLRTSVLSAITEVRPLPPVVPVDATAVPVVAAHAPVAAVTTAPAAVDELATRRETKARRTPVWLQVAAAILAVVAAGGLWRSATLNRDLTAATTAAAQVTAVLTAPDATTVSSSVSTGGRAAVVTSKTKSTSVLVTDGLTPAPDGKTYQIWFIGSGGTATSAGFVPPGDHTATVLDGDPATASAVGVTVEPAGGSAQPTTLPVLAVKV